MGAVVLVVGISSAVYAGPPLQPGITRTDLQRHDLSIARRETIQTRVDFDSGAVFPRHTHPGEEIVYVLKGSPEYQLEGKPLVTLNAGDVLFVPGRAIHAVRNVGSGSASELATYVVEKGNRSSCWLSKCRGQREHSS